MGVKQTMNPEILCSQSGQRTIFLARHGQSESNLEERISGQADPSLTEKGLRQAQRLATVLRNTSLTKILTSTLRRSIDTARPTAESQGIALCPLDVLKEMSFGVLEGQLRGHLDHEPQHLLDQWTQDKLHFRIPGGESLLDVQKRVLPLLSQVLTENPHGTLLVVGHRHTNIVILSALMGWSMESLADLSIRSKYVYEIRFTPTPRIYTISLTGKGRGTRAEGFFNEDDPLCSSHEHQTWSGKPACADFHHETEPRYRNGNA
jgi:alpha-ribazole phosphatase